MSDYRLKIAAIGFWVGLTLTAGGGSFTGSINFNPNLQIAAPPSGNLGEATQLRPDLINPMQINTTPTGIYATHGLTTLSQVSDLFMYPNSGSVIDLHGSWNFTVYKFTWAGSGTYYEYSVVSSYFDIVTQNSNFFNLFGTGTAYIKYASGPNAGQDAFDPSPAIWTLTGTQTGTTGWGLSTTALGSYGGSFMLGPLSVETKPDGTGVPVSTQTLTSNATLTVYAVGRTGDGVFVTNAPAAWSLLERSGGVASSNLVVASDGKSAVFTARAPGSALIGAGNTKYVSRYSGRITVVLPPIAGPYALSTSRNEPCTVSTAALLAVCQSQAGGQLSLSAVSPTSALGGRVELANNLITFRPARGTVGSDTFAYTLSDTAGGSAQGTVTVTISTPAGSGPEMLGLGIDAGTVTVQMAGNPGTRYEVRASADLIDWVPLGFGVAGSNGLFQFVEPGQPLLPQRFYRAWENNHP